MSRENITTKKIWAPNLAEMEKSINNIEDNTDAVVIQALTRDLTGMEVDEMNTRVKSVVAKALTRA